MSENRKKISQKISPSQKKTLHPRNRHQGHYDFGLLIKACPELASFVSENPYQELTIDFSNPDAVKALNGALLSHFYGISNWKIPSNYLCPPVPGRADYLHYVADLLSACNEGVIPRGDLVRVLDIGVGANCIYPVIGYCEYGWHFVGSDVDSVALGSAQQIVQSNQKLINSIDFRLQKQSSSIFNDLLRAEEVFDVSICNPPFHASLAASKEGTLRKWKNLGRGSPQKKGKSQDPLLNFGGQPTELSYPGGEAAFVRRMVEESLSISKKIFWFTTLISKEATLPSVYRALSKAKAIECRTIEMAQGQKKSRLVAWTFLSSKQQREWRTQRWASASL